jgi:hypothetical protein
LGRLHRFGLEIVAVCQFGMATVETAMRAKVEGPDFICIGMPKAGTAWLFDQINHHPDFWMPPTKGVHYFRVGYPRMTQAVMNLARAQRRGKLRGRALEKRDFEFMREAAALGGKPRDLAAYATLFRHKGDLLSGDITAAYADLNEDIIKQIAAAMPQTKIVMMVRDPVARAWSRISMAWRKGEFDAALLDDIAGLQDYMAAQSWLELDNAGPARIVARWRACAPGLPFHHVLLDDVISRPEQTRHEVLTFLGADSAKSSGGLEASHNRKSRFEKLKVGDAAMALMVEHFREELFACAGTFGDPARNWLRQYGLVPQEQSAVPLVRHAGEAQRNG